MNRVPESHPGFLPGRRGAVWNRLSAVFLGLALLAAGCEPGGAGQKDAGAVLFTDGLGRKVRLTPPARRIVSLAPSNTETLFAIGAGAQVAARDDLSDFPEAARSVRSVGTVGGKLNMETVITLSPDLVLAAEIHGAEEVRPFEHVGLTVFRVANPRTFEELFANMELLGVMTGHEAEAAKLSGSLRARVKAVVERTERAAARPMVFYELDATDATKPWTAGSGTFIDLLIRLAGGENLGASIGEGYPRISTETILRRDPDVIVVGDAAAGVTPEAVLKRPGWESLSAVRSGRVHAFDADTGSRPGPRLVDGLETLARLLHPEVFPK